MTIASFRPPTNESAALECSKCGALLEAKCSCGASYKYVSPRKRAEEAVAENPRKSNRTIAAEIGVGHMTVSRARRRTNGPNGPSRQRAAEALAQNPEKSNYAIAANTGTSETTVRRVRQGLIKTTHGTTRIGRDGRTISVRGPRIPLQDGETVESICRRGMALENEIPQAQAIKQLGGIGKQSYHEARMIILLNDREDLTVHERIAVQTALKQMNEMQRTRVAFESIASLADRIWGKRMPKTDKSAKRKLEQFEITVGIVIQSCVSGAKVIIPRLDPERRESLMAELDEAQVALRRLKARIKCAAEQGQ